jgi:Holliday junction resolvasome RuvABC ATP-dependent DNA helicase subunit
MSAQPDPVAARAQARVPGDPSRLLDVAALRQFVGADTAVAVLEDAADRAVGAGRPLEDTLIVGPDDAGKQVVARALARDAAQRIVELDAAWPRNARHLARIVRALEDRDALLLRRIDELRPGPLRMLVSLMGMRTLPREAEPGAPMADCTVIATATTVTRRMHVLRRMFPLQVELPAPGTEALTAAAYRAAQALGSPGSAELRAALAERVAVGTTIPTAPGNPNLSVNPALLARIAVARG